MRGPKLRATVPFRAVLISVAGLWVTYFAIWTLRWSIISGENSLEMMQSRAIVMFGGIAITLLLWLLLRLFDSKPLWIKAAAALVLSLPVALLSAQLNHMVFADMNAKMVAKFEEAGKDSSGNLIVEIPGGPKSPAPSHTVQSPGGEPPFCSDPKTCQSAGKTDKGEEALGFFEKLTDLAFSRYFMMLAWSAIYFSMLATAQVRVAERREQMFRSAAKAAELRSLRYQVNPHFLFNTLNSLSALVMTGKAEQAEKMIQTISSFYRHSLTNEPTSDVALEQEFDLQRHYLNIEEVRFPERLKAHFTLPEGLADARVPGMILQPLVENSVKYAVSSINRPVNVVIAAREEFDRLIITVKDDGPGIPEGGPNEGNTGFGIGLANVRDRLEARFGPDIVLESGPIDGGYQSEIRIPLTRNG
ncbi:MAG: histidine kinase [Erythrobacter sp.]